MSNFFDIFIIALHFLADVRDMLPGFWFFFGCMGNGQNDTSVFAKDEDININVRKEVNHPITSCSMSLLGPLILRRPFLHRALQDAKDQAEVFHILMGAIFDHCLETKQINEKGEML